MFAIFIYVGVEVSTSANLPEFMRQKLNIPASGTAPYIALFWASLMIGRWTAATDAFGLSGQTKKILKFIMPYLAFGVYLGVTALTGHNIHSFYPYAAVIVVLIIANLLSKGNPAKQLVIFSFLE